MLVTVTLKVFHGLLGLKDSSHDFLENCAIFFLSTLCMCYIRFDAMSGEKKNDVAGRYLFARSA
jgi:hypothetical protein